MPSITNEQYAQAQATQFARLTPEVYRDLEKRCKPIHVDASTTMLQTAYIAGQQSVLQILRTGYVVGE